MDAILTAVPWSGLGWGGLIFLVVLGIIRGDVVTRREHETALARLDDTIQRERAMADRTMSALQHLSHEFGTTADKVLSALPVEDKEGSDDGAS